MKSPLMILIELIVGLISRIFESINFTLMKMVELFISLSFIANLNTFGLIMAVLFGSIIFYFVLKYLFGTSKTLVVLIIFLVIILLFIIGIMSMTSSEQSINIH